VKENLNNRKNFPQLGKAEKLSRKMFKKNIHRYRKFFEEYLSYLKDVIFKVA